MSIVLCQEVPTAEMTDNLTAYFRTPLDVQAMRLPSGALEVDVAWPECEPLASGDLYSLLGELAPVSGLETVPQVIQNWRGVHEDDEFNREVMRLHRERFGKAWVAVAASRRLLLSVLEGRMFGVGYDQSLAINDRAVFDEAQIKEPINLLPPVARLLTGHYKRAAPEDEESEHLRASLELAAIQEWQEGERNDPSGYHPYGLDDIAYFSVFRLTGREEIQAMADRTSRIISRLEAQGVSADQLLGYALRHAFDSFVSSSGTKHYVDSTIYQTEEGIPLQAAYNQRLLTIQSGRLANETQVRMEMPNGSDEPPLLAVPGEKVAFRPFEFEGKMPDQPKLAPRLRWRVNPDGSRTFVGNHELLPTETTFDGRAFTYADVLAGKMLVAVCHPEIRQRWPKSYELGQGRFEGKYTGGTFRRIPIGEAQAPLLTAMSVGRLGQQLARFEEAA